MQYPQHPIVAKLVTDPGTAPKLTVLSGYVGAAGKPGYVRIYTSPTLDAYVEVPEAGVKYVADPATPSTPNTIWVDSSAVLTPGPTAAQPVAQLEAGAFLAGDIATRHVTTAAMNAGGLLSFGVPCSTWRRGIEG